MTRYVLGLDGGGTKTHALIMAADGVVQAKGTAGPCNIATVPMADVLASVRSAAEAALGKAGGTREEIRAVCAGVAGFSHVARRAQFRAGLESQFPAAVIAVEPDYAVALTAATGGQPGIVVIAGTGSVAYGENGAGEVHRAGAYGYLVDDGGSGYGVGRAALAAVCRAEDGTGDATVLTARLLSATGFATVADMIPAVYGGSLDRFAIAALAPVVAEAASEDGDAVAQAILMRAGGTLARLTEAVAARLFPDAPSSYPIAPIGSLWDAGPSLTDVFVRSLARFAPAAVFAPPRLPPAHGAALRALSLSRLSAYRPGN